MRAHPRPAGWPGALEEYVTAMRAAGRSPGTVKLHRHYLGLLADRHRSPWSVTSTQLLTFMAHEGWKAETRKSARQVVRGFYRWAHGSGYLDDDPAVALPSVTVPQTRANPTPEHLVRQIVRQYDPRLSRMAMLAAFGGLRAGEISRVHGHDLLGDSLRVRGKGGKVRDVPIVEPALLAWLQGLGDAWAFPNGLGGHLSPGHVSRLLSRAMPEGWTAHKLRHRCGTQAYAGTRDLLAVMELLGHSRPETTLRYVLLPDDAVRRAVAAAAMAS